MAVLHDINLAIRYSDRVALVKDGKLYDIDKPTIAIHRDSIKEVFGIDVEIIDTPLGKQVLPLAAVEP